MNSPIKEQRLVPNPHYRTKLRLSITFVALGVLASGALLGWLLSLDRDIGAQGGWITFVIIAVLNLIWWAPAMALTGPYYRSLSYDIREDEVIVHAGVLTRSVKHVPYRTVTNLTVRRTVLDRWLGLGSLDIQTAGISGANKAEQSLVGLENADEVYESVAAELRRFRGAMGPTAAEMEGATAEYAPAETLNALLIEVRAIRQRLEDRN